MDIDEDNPLVLPKEYDSAFVGCVELFGGQLVAVYSKNAVVKILQRDMTHEEAVEYFEYNMAGAWVGNGTPLYLYECNMEEFDNQFFN